MMSLQELFEKWKQFVARMNMKGVPLPTVRDPKTGIGSVSLTLLTMSSLLVVVGMVSKWSGLLGGIDMQNAMEFFYASSALYFGRNWRTKGGAQLSMDDKSDQDIGPK